MKSYPRVRNFALAALASMLGVGVISPGLAFAQQTKADDGLDVLQLRPNFYMIAGAGGNIAVQVGDMGAVLVDTGSAPMADRVLARIRKLSTLPVRFIIDTSADPDHVGGNEKLSSTGVSLVPAGNPNPFAITANGGAEILATDNVLARMSAPTGLKSPYPPAAWPTETFDGKSKSAFLNGEGIKVFSRPAAHTDGDSIVLFRRSDVLVVGEILDMNRFPVINLAKGGSIQGEIDALNSIIDLTITELPMVWQEGGTIVIPGRGRVCDQADVVEYRDMITIIRDVIASMIAKGMALDQIQAANPTREYRPRYGAESGPWTTSMFVEAVYKSLVANSAKK